MGDANPTISGEVSLPNGFKLIVADVYVRTTPLMPHVRIILRDLTPQMWVENHPFLPPDEPEEPPTVPDGPPLQPAKISLRVTTDILNLEALHQIAGEEPSADLGMTEWLSLTIHRPEDSANGSNLGLSDFFSWDVKKLSFEKIEKGFEIKGEGGPRWVGQYYAALRLHKWELKTPVQTIEEHS